MINPYRYQGGETAFNLHLEKKTAKWLRYAVDFPTAHSNSYPEQNTALGQYYQPLGVSPVPLVILVHGMGDLSLTPLKLLARALADRGIASFILQLVLHSSRHPEVIHQRFPNLTSEEWLEANRTSVIELRQIADWAKTRAEINEKQLALLGISLGGFISAIAMGLDHRFGAGVLIVTGGNSAKIAHLSRLAGIRRGYQRTEAEYREMQRQYLDYLDEVVERGPENVSPLNQHYLTDPLTYAHFLKGRPVLMLNARWDEAVPRESTLDFWEASGRPEISWFPASHAGIWFWYPFIRSKITKFLDSAFCR